MAAANSTKASAEMEKQKLEEENEAISSPVTGNGTGGAEEEEKKKKAEELRLEGNRHFREKRFQSALYAYTEVRLRN